MKKIFALLSLCLTLQGVQAADMPSSDPLYDAVFSGLDGQPFALSRLKGKVAVVNFWATWCTPCRKEIPDLVAAYAQYRERGVEFVGVAVEDGAEKVHEFARASGITYPLATGKELGITLMQQLDNKVAGLPFTLVLDAAGNVVAKRIGLMDSARLDKALQAAFVPRADTK